MTEGSQYLGMTAEQIADHDFKAEHGYDRPKPRGEFSIGNPHWAGLSKLIEECGEVLQVAGKLIGSEGSTDHWSGDLDIMLHEELGDLAAAMQFFVEANGLDMSVIRARQERKVDTFHKWHLDGMAKRAAAQRAGQP